MIPEQRLLEWIDREIKPDDVDWRDFRRLIIEIQSGSLSAPADREALMLALWDEKWDFTKANKRYVATNRTLKFDLQKDESYPLLLLKCVSAQTSIPLYV
jgi:hypothetical protein